jgi:hypothetical protein
MNCDTVMMGTRRRTRSAFRLLNANIARQFEFVQNTWLMSTHFRRRCRESAPDGKEYQAAASDILETAHRHRRFALYKRSGLI